MVKNILQCRFADVNKNYIINNIYFHFIDYFHILINENKQELSDEKDSLEEYYINDPIFPEDVESNPIQKSIETLKHAYIYNKADRFDADNLDLEEHSKTVKSLISLFHVILDLKQETIVSLVKKMTDDDNSNHLMNKRHNMTFLEEHDQNNSWVHDSKSRINEKQENIYSHRSEQNIIDYSKLICDHIEEMDKSIKHKEQGFIVDLLKEFYRQRFDTPIQSQILMLIRRHFLKMCETFKFLDNSVFIRNKSQKACFELLYKLFESFIEKTQLLIQDMNYVISDKKSENLDLSKKWEEVNIILQKLIDCVDHQCYQQNTIYVAL